MQLFKKISLLLASFLLFGAILLPATVRADVNTDDVCEGLALTGGNCNADPDKPGVDSTVKLIINLLSIVVGIISVVMIIIGGVKYVMSQGESSNVNGAKNTILYAIVGLIVVALAQVIVQFVLKKFK